MMTEQNEHGTFKKNKDSATQSQNHATAQPTLASKKADLRKFVSISNIQLQALINRISPDDRTRKVMQEDLAKQSQLMKTQIDAATSLQEAEGLYEKFRQEFK